MFQSTPVSLCSSFFSHPQSSLRKELFPLLKIPVVFPGDLCSDTISFPEQHKLEEGGNDVCCSVDRKHLHLARNKQHFELLLACVPLFHFILRFSCVGEYEKIPWKILFKGRIIIQKAASVSLRGGFFFKK